MTSSARIAARPARPAWIGRPNLRDARLLVLVAVVALAGCIPSAARSGSPAAGSAVPGASTPTPGPTGPTPVPSFVRPTPTPLPSFLAYVVKSGDNLNTIAHRFGTTGRSIAYWNRATYPSLDPEAPSYKPNLVRIGWTLVLIPNVVVDEQTLPEPTPNPTDPFEAEPTPS
jgi:hypothetical protein